MTESHDGWDDLMAVGAGDSPPRRPDRDERGRTLRLIRFFLPRLDRGALAEEIELEKRRREEEFALQAAERRQANEAAGDEIIGKRRRVETLLHELEDVAGALQATYFFLILLVTFTVGFGASFAVREDHNPVLLGLSILSLIGLFFVGASIRKNRMRIRKMLRAVSSRSRRSRSGDSISVSSAKAQLKQEIDALDRELEQLEQALKDELHALREDLDAALAGLDQKLDELVRLYRESIATESEVAEFTQERLEELRRQALPALGLEMADILDEHSAEVWAPTFLQNEEAPQPVRQDIEQSEEDILSWREDLVAPMRNVLSDPRQWLAFRGRILPLLGLADDDEPEERLNAKNAIRFSPAHQTYLAGHYFFQNILVTERTVGLFRGYVNVLSRRIAYTFALQIMHQDVAAIGIETALSRESYRAAGMTIDRHTRTLALELLSGTTYRMSGDAGSSAWYEAGSDAQVDRVISQANERFGAQIENIRALIMESRAGQGNGNGGAVAGF